MASGSSETTVKKGSTKHCCWGNCKNDSRYPDKLPSGTYFIRFPKPGNVKESMTQCEKDRENVKTEKAKKCVHACAREGFSIKNIKKDTFICFNHFIGCCGPTEEDPDPLLATLTDKELGNKRTRKQKPPKQRELIPPKAKKRKSENMTPNVESTDTFETTANNGNEVIGKILRNKIYFTGRNSTLPVTEQLFITLLRLRHVASTFLNWLIFTKSANIRFMQFLQHG